MVILQDSARILQKLPILQDLIEKWLSCKIWQKNGYLARFLQVRSGRAVLLLALIHAKICVKILHVRLGGANNMHPLRWGLQMETIRFV